VGVILILFGALIAVEKLYERSADFALRIINIQNIECIIEIGGGIASTFS